MSEEARVPLGRGGFASVDRRGPDGAPWIVIVPPLGMPGEVLEPFRVRLARALHVLTIELPGTGAASGLPALATTRDLASALVATLDRLGLVRAHLFGISLGGMIAQWAAIDAGHRFERIVLASTSGRGLDAARRGVRAKLAMARALISSDPALELARKIVSDSVRDDPHEMERIEQALSEHPRDREEVAWLAAAALRHDTRKVLSSIRVPTLVVTGELDELIPPAVQEELAAAIPGAERAVIAAAGHDVTIDQPLATAEVVEEFVLRTPRVDPQPRALGRGATKRVPASRRRDRSRR